MRFEMEFNRDKRGQIDEVNTKKRLISSQHISAVLRPKSTRRKLMQSEKVRPLLVSQYTHPTLIPIYTPFE